MIDADKLFWATLEIYANKLSPDMKKDQAVEQAIYEAKKLLAGLEAERSGAPSIESMIIGNSDE